MNRFNFEAYCRNYSKVVVYLVLVSSVAIGLVIPPTTSAGTSDSNTVGPSGSNTGYCLQLYNLINTYRSKHVVPALKWNRTLNEVAESLAMGLLSSPDTPIDPDDFEGVNYFGLSGGRPSTNLVISTWYMESSLYDFRNPSYGISYLNFTQLVWKSSTSIGIGVATRDNFSIVIARFSPSGNIKGRFRTNVNPARS